jgi:hypothetical protein
MHHKQAASCLLGLLFYPEDGGNMFLQSIGEYLRDYMVSSHNTAFAVVTTIRTLSQTSKYPDFIHLFVTNLMMLSPNSD